MRKPVEIALFTDDVRRPRASESARKLPRREPLRSLDAIHLAAALELGEALEAVVTYDGQIARAAEELGLPVVSPS